MHLEDEGGEECIVPSGSLDQALARRGRMMANRTAERLALLGIALAAVSPATARSVEYRWTSEPGMGGQITAAIQNAAGSAFRIYCATCWLSYRDRNAGESMRAELVNGKRRRSEQLLFVLLAVVIWRFIAIGVVAGWGFLVWMYYMFTGPPGPV
jgi:nitrate reductase NapE